MPLSVFLLGAQGSYWLLTGLWPAFHPRSFLYCTGARTDLSLVRLVGLLAAVIGGVLLAAAWRGNLAPEIVGLSIAAAGVAAVAQVWATIEGVAAPIYLVDAVLEGAILIGWGIVWWMPAPMVA